MGPLVHYPACQQPAPRQAVAYAIDRRALINLVGGPNLASPACQILPPGFPGHVDYCPYSKNPGAKWGVIIQDDPFGENVLLGVNSAMKATPIGLSVFICQPNSCL